MNGALLNWGDAIENSIDALATFGLKNDPGQLTWLLIHRSFAEAIKNLIKENTDLIRSRYISHMDKELTDEDYDSFLQDLDLSIETQNLTIDVTFFNDPARLGILPRMMNLFAQWLETLGVTRAEAQSITHRLPAYFVFALNKEWCTQRTQYEPIVASFDSPFTKANTREREWYFYSSWLHKQLQEPMFNEAFSLAKVFMPLRASYEKTTTTTRTNVDYDDEETKKSLTKLQSKASVFNITTESKETKIVVIDLELGLEQWLKENDSRDALRVIRGGPGSGKSSATKVFAAKQSLNTEWRILFIPLHRFDMESDLIDAVGRFVDEEGFLSFNPLDLKESGDRILVIFDGLDELSMQGQIGADVARKFLQEVLRKVESLNIRSLRFKAIISGRDFVVDANSNELRKKYQLLQLLPYYMSPDDRELFDHKTRHLLEDLRQYWWRAYGKALGIPFRGLPAELDRDEFREITAQPLLNYLIAVSFVHQELDFTRSSNRNGIYESLIKSVYQRVWSEHQHPSLKDISEEQFVRVLEEIALATWHSTQRTATLETIARYCENSGLDKILKSFQEGIREGVSRLLIAFYFRRLMGRETGQETFEFTHKTFSEYLTAKRLVRGVKRITYELQRRREDYDVGWDERDAIAHWVQLCGPAVMDSYIYKFISNEVEVFSSNDVQAWQSALVQLTNFIQRHGMPIERLEPRPVFNEELTQACNASTSILAALSACASVTKEISHIDWPTPHAFSEWLSLLHKHRLGSVPGLVLRFLSYMWLRGCDMSHRDLYGAKFISSDLENAIMDGSNLSFANLSKANFRRASMRSCALYSADCKEAIFNQADLEGSSLQRADLSDAHLVDANLRRTNFSRCTGYRADLQGADLKEAIFSGASMRNATLKGAKLQRAELLGAGMQECDFQGSQLENASLNVSNCERANFRNADLRGANLQFVNLVKADLKEANLAGANLKNANLCEADLRNANLKGADLAYAITTGTLF